MSQIDVTHHVRSFLNEVGFLWVSFRSCRLLVERLSNMPYLLGRFFSRGEEGTWRLHSGSDHWYLHLHWKGTSHWDCKNINTFCFYTFISNQKFIKVQILSYRCYTVFTQLKKEKDEIKEKLRNRQAERRIRFYKNKIYSNYYVYQ